MGDREVREGENTWVGALPPAKRRLMLSSEVTIFRSVLRTKNALLTSRTSRSPDLPVRKSESLQGEAQFPCGATPPSWAAGTRPTAGGRLQLLETAKRSALNNASSRKARAGTGLTDLGTSRSLSANETRPVTNRRDRRRSRYRSPRSWEAICGVRRRPRPLSWLQLDGAFAQVLLAGDALFGDGVF